MILVIILFPKSCKILIHIAFQIHITIRFKGQALPFHSNQVTSDPLYCLSMNPPWTMGEPDTLVHWKMDTSTGFAGDIHQHYHKISIPPRFIKGRSISVCYQWNFWCRSNLLINIQHSHCFQNFIVQQSLGQCELSWLFISLKFLILSWSVPKKSTLSAYISTTTTLP